MERLERIDASLAKKLGESMQQNAQLMGQLQTLADNAETLITENERKARRIDELLASNNEFEERARHAQAETQKWRTIAHRMLELVEQAPEDTL